MRQEARRDTAVLVASQAFFNGALAVEVMWLGRWLEREPLGLYFYALSLGSLLEVGVHWGAQHYLTRQAAADPAHLRQELPALAALALVFTGLAIAGLSLVHGALALIAAAAMVRAAAGALGGVFIGQKDVLPPVAGRVLSQVLLLAGLWLLVRPRPSLQVLGFFLLAISAAYLLVLVGSLGRLGFPEPGQASLRAWPAMGRRLGGQLWPFVLLFLVGQCHYRVDAALLKWLSGLEAVSTAMLAFKWVEGLFFVPAVIATAAIPYLLEARAAGRLAMLLRRYAWGLALGLSGVAVLLMAVGAPFLGWALGPAFEASRPYYYLLAWAAPLQGLGFFFSTALVAFGRERLLLLLSACTALCGILAKAGGLHFWALYGYAVALLAALLLHALSTGIALYRQVRREQLR